MSTQSLFAPSFFKHHLNTFHLESIENFESKREIINQWIKGLKSGSLKKKETTIDADFMNNFFGEVLGYEHQISKGAWNLEKKYTIPNSGGKEADGVLGYFLSPHQDLFYSQIGQRDLFKNADVRVIIEVKPIGVNLDKKQNRVDRHTPVEQAFTYANKLGANCKWVIVSNYSEIRLYNKNIGEERYEAFFIERLTEEFNLKRFFYLLQYQRLFLKSQNSHVDIFLNERQQHLQSITQKFYAHYKKIRLELFEHLRKENKKYETFPLFLLEKTQKILDRILFICFCQWLQILQGNLLDKVINNAKESFDTNEGKLWDELKGLFKNLDKGSPPLINKFNGGLFREDIELNDLVVTEWALHRVLELRKYDYDNDLTVNILGHIFEQSISDYEEISTKFLPQLDLGGNQSVESEKTLKKDAQRKKEGIFYTPEFITSFIVNEAVGGWLEDKKINFGYYDLPELTIEEKSSLITTKQHTISSKLHDKNTVVDKVNKHLSFWFAYRDALRDIKILDPACGSGAFLVKVFDYLKREGEIVNKAIAELKPGQQSELFDLDRHILNDNIFGVDFNQSSVEISQLSLWLKTADRSKELTTLDNNIQCGNSLIDDKAIAGDLAFDWNIRFKEIMETGGFDVVIGNPPYVSANNMKLSERHYFNTSGKFQLIQGKWDLYILFIELSLRLLNENGYFSMIVPYGLLNQPYAQKIRREIVDKNSLIAISDLHTHKIFSDATVPVCIPLIKKGVTNEQVKIYGMNEDIFFFRFSTDINKYKESEGCMFRTENLLENDSIIQKIKIGSEAIADHFYVSTGAEIHGREQKTNTERTDKTRSKFKSLKREFKVGLKPYIEGSAIPKSRDGRYCFPSFDYYLDYEPNVMRAAKFPELFESPKLILRASSGLVGIIATLDERKIYTSHKCTIIIQRNDLPKNHRKYKEEKSELSLYYLISLLNSRLINFYYGTVYGGFIDVYPENLKAILIKTIPPKEQEPFIKNAKTMLKGKQELEELKQKFLNILISDFKLETLSSPLKNWINLNWSDLDKELKKANLTVRGRLKEEWFERFNHFKDQAIKIQNTLTLTDQDIDEMVYQLYGLTPEERNIVMGNNSN